MKKIAVIGVYGSGDNFTTGQAVKCHVLIDWMMKTYGTNEVTVVNTYQWKKNPIKLFISVLLAMSRCKNIIMLPAQNGVTVFAPLIYILNKIYERSIHYIVIGGWLPDMLKKKARLKHYLKYFDGIYVETKSMKRKLQADGMQNVYYMPNSREYVNIENIEEREFTVPVKLCTYSRVVKEKGIEDAIEICELANKKLNDKVFCIDIYGKIALDYKDQFLKILQNHRDITTYQGCKEPEETVNILMHYFALLFPT